MKLTLVVFISLFEFQLGEVIVFYQNTVFMSLVSGIVRTMGTLM